MNTENYKYFTISKNDTNRAKFTVSALECFSNTFAHVKSQCCMFTVDFS